MADDPILTEHSAFDAFLNITKKYRSLSLWAGVAGVVPPFVAYFTKIMPPWPDGVAAETAVVELIALIIAFQFIYRATRKQASRFLVWSLVLLGIFAIVYLSLQSFLVYDAGIQKLPQVKGFICYPEVAAKYPGQCPFVNDDVMKDANWDADKIWFPWTIMVSRLALALTWFASFIMLAAGVSSFVIFQVGQTARPAPRPPKPRIGSVTATIPHNAPFGMTATNSASGAAVDLRGFSDAELAVPLRYQELECKTVDELLYALRALAKPDAIRPYTVTREGAVYAVTVNP